MRKNCKQHLHSHYVESVIIIHKTEQIKNIIVLESRMTNKLTFKFTEFATTIMQYINMT